MPTEDEVNERVFKLMLIGLTWVQQKTVERSPNSLPGWTGNGILLTLAATGALPRSACKLITSNPSQQLRDYVFRQSRLLKARPNGRVYTSSKLISDSTKPLLVMVTTHAYFGDMIFKPRGYKLLASSLGQAFAHKSANGFEDTLTQQEFMDAWDQHVSMMKNMYGALSEGGYRR
jgi:hypothetical protein